MTIWKFEVEVNETVQVEMPHGAVVISVGCQSTGQSICLWAIVDEGAQHTKRKFYIRGTGHRCDGISLARFIGTVQTPSGLVWHVFE